MRAALLDLRVKGNPSRVQAPLAGLGLALAGLLALTVVAASAPGSPLPADRPESRHLPGVVFLAAGPLVSALGGAVAGGVVGGLAGGSGAVHPLGLPHHVGRYIEDRLRAGDILISVHTDDSILRDRAFRVFRAAGVEDIYSTETKAA